MKRFLLPSVSLVLAACVDHSKISRLDEVALKVIIEVGDGPPTLIARNSDCPTLDAVATMNGKLISREEQGGEYTALDGSLIPVPRTFCAEPTWRLPSRLPDEPVTELEIQDDTGRLLFGVAHLGAPRSLSWLSPASGEVHWGDLISLQWAPATDHPEGFPRLKSADRDMILNRVDRSPEYGKREGVLTFRLPEAPPDHGSAAFDGQLLIAGSGVSVVDPSLLPGSSKVYARVEHCEPRPGFCSAEITVPDGTYSVPVTIR